jgi:Tfp pilus assembly protein PilO
MSADFPARAGDPKKKRRVAMFASGVVAFLGLGYLCYADWTTLQETREFVETERKKLDFAVREIAQTQAVEDKVILLRETVREYVRILPDDKEINAFVDQLAQFGKKSGVRVTKLDDGDARARVARGRGAAVAAFDRVVYKIGAEGDVEQLLEFLDMFENHERFVRIASFKVESAEKGGRSTPTEEPTGLEPEFASGPGHKVHLELETYVYNPKVRAQQPVVIPGEARKLERLRAASGETADARRDLALASYVREAKPKRRDVFRDPRKPAPKDPGLDPETKKAMDALFVKLKAGLDDAIAAAADEAKQKSLVGRLRASAETDRKLAAFESLIRDAEAGTPELFVGLAKRVESELTPAYAKLAQGRAAASRRSALGREYVVEATAKIREAVASRRYDEAAAVFEDLKRRRSGAADVDYEDLFEEARGLAERAEAEAAFDLKNVEFGGVVVYRDRPERSVVIINGRPFMPGDRLDEETTVVGITSAEVVFEYRGRSLVRALKASQVSSAPSKANKPDRRKRP